MHNPSSVSCSTHLTANDTGSVRDVLIHTRDVDVDNDNDNDNDREKNDREKNDRDHDREPSRSFFAPTTAMSRVSSRSSLSKCARRARFRL